MIKITENFTYEEMIFSATAQRLGIGNYPNTDQLKNLLVLCRDVLQPSRDEWGKPMQITSGFRNQQLNKAVGGVANSYHLQGKAADIKINGAEQGNQLAKILLKRDKTDTVIIEHTKQGGWWLHVQWSEKPRHKLMQIYK